VRDLVVTHYDTDHMGNLGAVKAVSGCVVWAHPRCEEFFGVVEAPERAECRRRSMAVAGGATDALVEHVASVREEVEGADAPARPDRLLEDGTVVPTAAGEWRAVELPGHSPSQVGLWHEGEAMLISADVMMSEFSSFGDAEASEDPIGEWRCAIDRVRGLQAQVAFPGHGRPITDVSAVADRYRTGFAQNLRTIESLLGREPATTATVMAMLRRGDDAPALEVWRFLETNNYLKHLAAQGRVKRGVAGSGQLTWARDDARQERHDFARDPGGSVDGRTQSL
jgi:glyoxylase-like metal-dependent hydrolase (beta-lactamase superfamily II)